MAREEKHSILAENQNALRRTGELCQKIVERKNCAFSPYGVMHGKSSPVYYNEGGENGLFAGLSNPFTAGRYHSLVIDKDTFPKDDLEITAWTEDGLIMAARHKVYRHLQGVQFHPESIITAEGKTIVRNFVKLIEQKEKAETQD
ncbi:anthranilate synthase beta subunit 1, chloroplastic-like [Nicotiana tabacum]|uniref:Anthranilate synthase beta subunit 1, chloroplastic-like n=1 Tax=Nicotiana tabacum TaxID=4097 RepID=A0AC58TAH4_TOBAC